jgi:copper chaperone CopZ
MGKAVMVTALVSVFGIGVASVGQQEEKPKAGQLCLLKVSGMHCGACAATVEKAAKKVAGVTAAKVSHSKATAEITYDPSKATPEAIAKAITDQTPFKAEPSKRKE